MSILVNILMVVLGVIIVMGLVASMGVVFIPNNKVGIVEKLVSKKKKMVVSLL